MVSSKGRTPDKIFRGKLVARYKMRVAGLMSGTSADGADVAIVDINGPKVLMAAFDTFPYPPALRRAILRLCEPKTGRVDEICHYNFVLGRVFADAIIRVCDKSGIALRSIDLVGSHGQTIYHNPRGKRYGREQIRSTLQIGEPSIIAERTGITTVADFRPRDMAAGGEGAPLVPYADYILFWDRYLCRAIQNIGGIANVTFLPLNCREGDIIAFDTGPGNMVIDRITSLVTNGKLHLDQCGKMASRGRVDAKLLNDMLRHPFLERRPPKSTGREEFGWSYSDRFYNKAIKKGLGRSGTWCTKRVTPTSVHFCRTNSYLSRVSMLWNNVIWTLGSPDACLRLVTSPTTSSCLIFVRTTSYSLPWSSRMTMC